MPNKLTNEILEELRSYIDRDVAGGFLSADEIVETVVEILGNEADSEALRVEAVKATALAMNAHASDQSSWPSVTDCDRLDSAFAELDKIGIISRQNFSCCGTCGSGDILEVMSAVSAEGRSVHGYAFYHAQDTESATEGYGICLNYGADQDNEAAALAVAKKVIDVVEAHGLTTIWNGTWGQRITVSMDWKRRRTDGLAA